MRLVQMARSLQSMYRVGGLKSAYSGIFQKSCESVVSLTEQEVGLRIII